MTELLEQALAKLQKLPPSEQDAIAAVIMAEIEDEHRWDAQFADSQDQLARLAEKVRKDICAGRVKDQGMDHPLVLDRFARRLR